MVNEEENEERWDSAERKKEQDARRMRIESTGAGYAWMNRIDRIGKGDDVKQLLRRMAEQNR